MKRLVVALTALAAFTGSALAADMAPRYAKAPAPMAPIYNWTGFYIFGGGGGGIWSADSNVNTFPGAVALTRDQRMGGDGWFGTVGAGYDMQFGGKWVAGVFGDAQFGSLKGSLSDPFFVYEGRVKLEDQLCSGRRDWATSSRRTCCPTSMAVTPVRSGRARTQSFIVPGGAAVTTTPFVQP